MYTLLDQNMYRETQTVFPFVDGVCKFVVCFVNSMFVSLFPHKVSKLGHLLVKIMLQ